MTEQEKHEYLTNIGIKTFNSIWQDKPISSTIFDINGHIMAMTKQTMIEFGIQSDNGIKDTAYANLSVNDVLKFSITENQEHAEAIQQIILKQSKLQQIVVTEKIPVNFVSLVPRNSEFKARLINYIPIFHHETLEVVGLQSFASEFNLFGINEYLDILQNKPSPHLSVLTEDTKLPIRFAPRQHEILFLLAIGLSQTHAAQILNISRGAVASVINAVLCPRFNIAGSNTAMLVNKAIEMDYHRYIPSGLCKPFIIILDQRIMDTYFDINCKCDLALATHNDDY